MCMYLLIVNVQWTSAKIVSISETSVCICDRDVKVVAWVMNLWTGTIRNTSEVIFAKMSYGFLTYWKESGPSTKEIYNHKHNKI